MPVRKTLIIAEKPSVARALAAWLAHEFRATAREIDRTHILVGDFVVSWLRGHLLENVEPHEYDPRYEKWSAAYLPIVPPIGGWLLRPKVDKKTKKVDAGAVAQLKVLKALLADATDVIGLGDPDQEGQLLQDEFLLWAGCKLPTQRLWLAAVDDASIKKAWAAMKPNKDYEGWYWSALARSHADWLFGINGTRGCTEASRANGGNALLSVGRVQTPTLALIVARELEIRAFKSVEYFTPFIELASAPAFKASWSPDKEDTRLDAEGRLLDRKLADAIKAACEKAGSATVTSVKSDKGKEAPPLPFSLSSLQAHMSRKFGMGVADTLKYAQSLYEKKIASYPRVDTEYLPESQHAEAASILGDIGRASPKGLGAAPGKADPSIKSKAFNDKKVTAHHAIAPRPVTASQLAALSDVELLVWTEIAKRYLLQFFPAAEFLSSEIELKCASETFRATGKVYTNRGWKDAFVAVGDEDEEEATPTLPKVAKGDVIKLRAAGVDSTKTKAPKRFTEGTLVEAMKAVHRFVADPKLKAVLRENVGIGTEATRANVIGELFGRNFIVLEKKKKEAEIKPTDLGEQLIDALPRQMTAPDMTALWQQAMDEIRKTGEAGYRAFITAQAKWLGDMVRDIPTWFAGKSLVDKSKKAALTVEASAFKCTKCSSGLNRINGKFGWFFGCSNGACKAIFKEVDGKPVEKAPAPTGKLTVEGVTNGDKCPKCKKGEMLLRACGPATKTPGKQFLACSNFFAKGKAKCDHSMWPK